MRTLNFLGGLLLLTLLGACASNNPTPVSANIAPTATSATSTSSSGSGVSDPVVVNVNPQQQQQRQRSRNSVECRQESRTGSHFRERRCMSQRERDEIRDQAQEWMRSGGVNGSTMTVR